MLMQLYCGIKYELKLLVEAVFKLYFTEEGLSSYNQRGLLCAWTRGRASTQTHFYVYYNSKKCLDYAMKMLICLNKAN